MEESHCLVVTRPEGRSFVFRDDSQQSMEELELTGEQTVKELNKKTRNILAPLSYHWPNGVLYYTIDAAFSDSERAVIASGFTHVEENSCIRSVED